MPSTEHTVNPGAADVPEEAEVPQTIQEPRLWSDGLWTARVLKNEDDDGWAVAMTRAGEAEPALVGPWTMGRDKKNPKPLDTAAFHTLVKTANEVLRRHEQQLHAQLHKQVFVETDAGRVSVRLDIEPDDDHPTATLRAEDADGNELAQVKVSPGFRLDGRSAREWIAAEYARPGR